eukprot:3864093-Rhodomonas_salina.1
MSRSIAAFSFSLLIAIAAGQSACPGLPDGGSGCQTNVGSQANSCNVQLVCKVNFCVPFSTSTATSSQADCQSMGSWDTGFVTVMSGLFAERWVFNENITAWDTSRVTDMYRMFSGAKTFDQNIGAWDTSRVTNMYQMFDGARVFNQNI